MRQGRCFLALKVLRYILLQLIVAALEWLSAIQIRLAALGFEGLMQIREALPPLLVDFGPYRLPGLFSLSSPVSSSASCGPCLTSRRDIALEKCVSTMRVQTQCHFSPGNCVATVDGAWFAHAIAGNTLGIPVHFCPPEEMLWSKSYVMERERYDGADIVHLLHACSVQFDWHRLLERFTAHWRVLLNYLVLFPSECLVIMTINLGSTRRCGRSSVTRESSCLLETPVRSTVLALPMSKVLGVALASGRCNPGARQPPSSLYAKQLTRRSS